MNPAIAQLRQGRIMGDENQRRPATPAQVEQQLDNRAAGGLIQVSGWLVGDKDRWLGRQSAGNCNALLLAPGQLAGVVTQPVTEANRLQLGGGALMGVGGSCKLKRNCDILKGRHRWDQMK